MTHDPGDVPTDEWGLWLEPYRGSRTARTLLEAFESHGWIHNGKEWGVSGQIYTYTRPWKNGETEILQICLSDGHWNGYAAWWTIDRVVAIIKMAQGRHWIECNDHYRQPTHDINKFGDLLAVIRRPSGSDLPANIKRTS